MAFNFKKVFKFWDLPLVFLLAVIFFVYSSTYVFLTHQDGFTKWQSPDETANYAFSKLYAESNKISFFEKYNLVSEELIHPRSMRSDLGEVKPVSFLGIMIIYGGLAEIFGTASLPYFTPFFGSVSIFFCYLLIRKIFGRKNALISAFLLTFFPVLVYYSARSMFHNVLFVSLLVVSLYFLVLSVEKRNNHWRYANYLFCIFAGASLAGSLMARTSELIWVGPVLVFLWVFNFKRFHPGKVAIFLASLILFLLPMFNWNYYLYGSSFRGGYVEMNQAITNLSKSASVLTENKIEQDFSSIGSFGKIVKDNLFYFGINLPQSKGVFTNYFVKMFKYLFYLSLLGAVILILNKHYWKKKYFIFLASWILTSIILIVYYGSWKFNDNPDATRATIGNSYTRYWLPIYFGAIPLASLALIRLSNALVFFKHLDKEKENESWKEKIKRHFSSLRPEILRFGIISVATILLLVNFVAFTLYGSEEGLFYAYHNQLQTKSEYEKIIKMTEPNAVIVTFYYDKVVFPDRKVIIGNLNDPNMNKIYSTLAQKMPVYYLHFKINKNDIDYLNQSRLSNYNLRIDQVSPISRSFGLYRLSYFLKVEDEISKITKKK